MSITQRTCDRATVVSLAGWRQIGWTVAGMLAVCLPCAGCGGGNSKGPPAQPAANAGPAAQQPAPGLPVMVREEAHVGVGAKGHDYKPGVISTPVSAYFKAKEKIVFEIRIPHAIRLHKNLYGSAPVSQEEFMEKIIKDNQIELPELPPGHTYVYDPDSEQLYVEHPEDAVVGEAGAG